MAVINRYLRDYEVVLFLKGGGDAKVRVTEVDAPAAIVRVLREFSASVISLVIREEATGLTYDVSIRGKGPR